MATTENYNEAMKTYKVCVEIKFDAAIPKKIRVYHTKLNGKNYKITVEEEE